MRRNDDEILHIKLRLAEEHLLPKALAGERWAIENLLLVVAEVIEEGGFLTPKLAAYIAGAFRKIHSGEKADGAFGIARKPGERNLRDIRQKNYLLASAVERHRYAGMTKENALYLIEESTGISEDTIRAAHKQYCNDAKREIQFELDALGKVMPIILP